MDCGDGSDLRIHIKGGATGYHGVKINKIHILSQKFFGQRENI